jgi:hypothetical protein
MILKIKIIIMNNNDNNNNDDFQSEKPKEIIDLNDVSIHLLDDSYFSLSNSFQIIVYNNIKEKTRKKAFVYYFVAESSLDRQEWFSHIRDIAYCCQTCNIAKMILYEYNQKINGHNINHSILNNKVSEISDTHYSHTNSHNVDSESINSKIITVHNGSSNFVSSNNGNEHVNTTNITEQIKKSFEPEPVSGMPSKSLNTNKSLITFAEALDDPLIFINSYDQDNSQTFENKSSSNSPNASQGSLNKIIGKSPVPSQKSLTMSNQHDDQSSSLTLKNPILAQRFHEHNKDKKQNRYSTSFLESSKTVNTNNLRRDSSAEINTGSNLKKDSSFFKLIKNNAKNINIFSSVSDESIDNLAKDPSSGTIQSSKQNCHYSIISNIPHSKISQYSIPNNGNNSLEEDLNNMFEYLNNKNKYTINRNIKLCILEARNLFPNEKKKNLEFYTFIFFDDIVQAKTSKQGGSNPFWGEEFTFENVLPCLNNIHLIICQQHRVNNDTEVGHVIIPINKLHSNKRIEEWIPLTPLYNNNDNFNASIRVGITLIDEHILPTEDYNEFIEYILQPSLEPVIRLGNVVQQREEFAKTLLYVLMDKQKEVDGIKALVSLEIKNTDDPNIIFRGNSLTTKIIDQYMKLIGSRYLSNTLRRQIQIVYNLKESCEVDPSKIDKSEDIKKHWKKLLAYVNNFWEAIRQSVNKCPSKLKEIFSFTKMEVSKTFENENTVQYSSISGFIFLRFFCPAILSPKLFGLNEQHPDPVTARTLTLIAKILQNLANLTEFASKEPHMGESNIFIKNHINEMKNFIDAISVNPDKEEENSVVDYDVRSQYEKLYRFYRSNCRSCFDKSDIEDKKMLDIIQNISNIHIKYKKDLLNYQISLENNSIRKVLNNSESSLYDVVNGNEEDENEDSKESEACSSHIKKELSNYVIDDNYKNEIDGSLKNIIFTIRRYTSLYNKKDNTKKQYSTLNRMSFSQYSPYIEDIFSPSQRTSFISTISNNDNNNNSNNNTKSEENDNKSVNSAHSLSDVNAISLNELNGSSNRLNINSRNSLNSNSSNSIHTNSYTEENNNNNNENLKDDDDDDEIISITEGLNLLNNQPNYQIDKRNRNVELSRHNSIRKNSHYIKVFTNAEVGSSNYSSSSTPSPVSVSPIEPHYTLTSGGDDNYQNGQYSPNSKKRFPLNMKRKISMTLNSLTGSHSSNIHRDHGKVSRDY